MIKCSFCGYAFSQEEALRSCQGCALHYTCCKTKCPRCGYEIPRETGLIKWLRKNKEGRNYAK